MDFPTKSELIINNLSHEEIVRYLNVDSLGYLTVPGMMKAVNMPEEEFCKACFDGKYPLGVEGVVSNKEMAQGAKCD
jgi:amidophosphoribosyltransferase